MKLELLTIPGLSNQNQSACRLRALSVNGTSLALAALEEWERHENADYRKIIKVLRIVGQVGRLRDEKKVKKCSNPDYGDVYEIRADKGKARLMFFYDESDGLMVICTNSFWKGSGHQDTAFKQCAQFRALYLGTKS